MSALPAPLQGLLRLLHVASELFADLHLDPCWLGDQLPRAADQTEHERCSTHHGMASRSARPARPPPPRLKVFYISSNGFSSSMLASTIKPSMSS